MATINILKSLIQKESLIWFLNTNKKFSINEFNNSWILETDEELSQKQIKDIKNEIIYIQNSFYIENKVSEIRKILYKKAFSPINYD